MGYNLEQSKIAIGAGRLIGRGFQNGTQTKMGFVPEQHTDFIFCTIGEEWGFVGILFFFVTQYDMCYFMCLNPL
jgi:rod shape determining protein RodA